MSFQERLRVLRMLVERMNALPDKDLLGKETEHEWIALATDFAKLQLDQRLIEIGLNFAEYQKIRRMMNVLNSKLKSYNHTFTKWNQERDSKKEEYSGELKQLKQEVEELKKDQAKYMEQLMEKK